MPRPYDDDDDFGPQLTIYSTPRALLFFSASRRFFPTGFFRPSNEEYLSRVFFFAEGLELDSSLINVMRAVTPGSPMFIYQTVD